MFVLTDTECDQAAELVHERVKRLALDAPIDPLAFCGAAGIELSCVVPRGCLGMLRTEPPEIRFVPSGRPRADVDVLTHELGHLGAQEIGHLHPHHEPSVDRVGGRIVLPTLAMERVVRDCHWIVPTLLHKLAAYPPLMVLARAAEAGHGIAVVHLRGRRYVFAPDVFQIGDALPFEAVIVAEARRTGLSSLDLFGITAWPFHDGAWPGVGILIPGRTVDRMMRHIPAG